MGDARDVENISLHTGQGVFANSVAKQTVTGDALVDDPAALHPPVELVGEAVVCPRGGVGALHPGIAEGHGDRAADGGEDVDAVGTTVVSPGLRDFLAAGRRIDGSTAAGSSMTSPYVRPRSV